MSAQSASSHTLRELSAEISPDQSGCSDTGDVLIRSTRADLWDRKPGPAPGSVQITVQKLRNTPPDQSVGSRTEKQPNIRQLGARQTLMKRPGAAKENRQPPAAEPSPDTKLSAGAERGRRPGTDLLTSRFAAGGRGVVLAALKQRSHSAPGRREVKVQLLSPQPDTHLRISSQSSGGVAGVQTEAGSTSAALGDATKAAAAAVAAAAPLIKAQSDMEARVSQLVNGVEKLLQADKASSDRTWGSNQETLRHQDMLHSQQLQLQSQLLESAQRTLPATSDLTAAGPPARLAVTHMDAAVSVLSNQQQSSPAATAKETGPVAMVTAHRDRWTEQTRHNWSKHDGPSVSKAAHLPEGTCLQVVRKADAVLGQIGRLENEMGFTPEDSLGTSIPPAHHRQSQQKHPQSQQNYSHRTHPQVQSHPSGFQPSQSHSRRFQSHQSVFHKVQTKHTHTQHPQPGPAQRPVAPSVLEEASQVLRRVRRQKKVLDENLEALLRAKTGEVLQCQLDALAANRDAAQEVRIKKTVDAWISTLTKDIQAEISQDTTDAAVTSQQGAAQSSAHSARRGAVGTLRGTGRRRAQTAERNVVQEAEPDTQAGESYLARLYGRAPHEGLRRTLKKRPYLRFSSPASPLGRKPRPRLVESVRGVKVKSCKTQTCLASDLSTSAVARHRRTFSSAYVTSGDPTGVQPVAMAIPLGRPRVEASSRGQLREHQQEVTSSPGAAPTASVEAPERQLQDQSEAQEAELDPDIVERKSEKEVDEEHVFPGTDFLCVADVQEELGAPGEEAVQLAGGPSPPLVLYQGPRFPPLPPSALPAQDKGALVDVALENRLVAWVEQQLMSRMISEMFRRPPSDTAQNVSPDHLESEERSLTSDIVEAAGGGGLQLFVDSNIEVDSDLIRQLVNEVLTEMVSLMLGQLDTGPGLEPPDPEQGAAQQVTQGLLVPTPLPTPPPSPIPSGREATPLTTPSPSEPISQLNEESPQPITAREHVTTPTSSPEPAPSAGSPPAVHHATAPLTWGDAELPLEEEQPEEHLDAHGSPLLMSVAEEVPPLSSPHPSAPPRPPSPPVPTSRPASVSSCSEESSSSSAVTEALKHISEGEVLISMDQRAALTGDEAACICSTSLQELPDMESDPPSEGQVRCHDLLLTLLPRMEQSVSHQGERPQPEGSWGRGEQEEVSVGEVRDNRTTNPRKSTKDRTPSPGQISQCADVSDSFEATNQGSDTLDDLMVEPLGTLTSDLQTDLSLSPPPAHLENTHTASQVGPIKVNQSSRQTEGREEQRGGTRRMDVHLPSISPEQEEVMEEWLSAATDTDSCTSDVF